MTDLTPVWRTVEMSGDKLLKDAGVASSAFSTYSDIIFSTWFGFVGCGDLNLTQPSRLSSQTQLS